jgi:hypothetical protein
MTAGDTTETQREDLWSSIASLLPALWLPLCGVFILAFLYAVTSRLAYPYPLEWLEPDTPDIVARIVAGLPVYVEPSYAYVPSMKTPLYYYVVTAFSPIFGNGLLAGRGVSILSILGVCGFIWQFVRREGGSRLWAVYGVAFFLATYHIAHDWYDIARLDSFYLLLTLAAAFLLRFASGMRGAMAAGLVFALAFFTKQAALMLMIPVLLLDAFAERRRALTASAIAASLIMAGMLGLHLASDGWSTFFLIEVPRHVVIEPDRVMGFWTSDIALPLALASLASLGWILRLWFVDRGTALFYTGLLGGALLIGWTGRANIAGSPNVLMPAYAVFAITLPLALQTVLRRWSNGRGLTQAGCAGAHIVALIQLAILFYDPRHAIPTASDKTLSDSILAKLRSIDGGILTMDDRYFTQLLGGNSVGLDYSLTDLVNDRSSPVTAKFQASIADALRAGKFAGVVDPPDFLRDQLAFGTPLSLQSTPPERVNRFTPRMQSYSPLAR